MSSQRSILPLAFDEVGFRVREAVLLDALSFRIEAGPPSIVLGPNGAGKSLTMRLAHQLLRPTSGRITWCGEAAQGASARHRQAMVFERPVHLRRSALANVEYALAIRGVARSERRAEAERVLDRTGLAGLGARSARALSAGEQQRLAIARAWALEPEVLFLDEPTAALDPSGTRRVEELIEVISASGTKIVMTTHDLGQARRLASEILFLHCGTLREHGPAADFFESPKTREARAFLEGELLW